MIQNSDENKSGNDEQSGKRGNHDPSFPRDPKLFFKLGKVDPCQLSLARISFRVIGDPANGCKDPPECDLPAVLSFVGSDGVKIMAAWRELLFHACFLA